MREKLTTKPAREFPQAKKVSPRNVGFKLLRSPINYRKSIKTFEVR